MTDPRHALGLAAEEAVARWLTTHGWRVIERRLRSACGGEVDIVALDSGDVLVAIEVRARRSRRAGQAAVTVDERRVARLRRTLAGLASSRRLGNAGLRVDLVTAEPADGRNERWRLVRMPGIG